MTALDRFIERLNRNPILWSLGLGIGVYFCAFWLAVLGMFERFPLSFEIGFLSAGSLVMAYHWAISRYIIASNIAQFIQVAFGIGLISISMFLIGAAMHDKAYEWVNVLLFSS
ncbi:hypothetical protein N8913_04130 [Litoricola sp.]|nr:hypothetical protein [Litorivicinus sp.]